MKVPGDEKANVVAAGSDLQAALQLLADRLEFAGTPSIGLLVGGGAALNALGLVMRTTGDIDVIGPVEVREGQLVVTRVDQLPPYLAAAVLEVARDLRLPDDWLNMGPASLLDFGLPRGCVQRAFRKTYGVKLTIYFVSRVDQIHFKLYAAADQGGGVHLADLVALDPSSSELLDAAQWAMTHDPSPGFREVLRGLLTQMGHQDVADRV